MEAAAASARGGASHHVPSSSVQQPPSRKEWRAISEHSFRNNGTEEAERVKSGQTEEKTIYEEGVEIDFCSINIDGGGGLSEEVLQQRLHEVRRQREELVHVEVELRAQAIARSEVLVVHKSFKDQLREHTNVAANLKEELQRRDHHINELELKMEAKDRELRALNNEAAWAKEDFLREQNEKLATFRRERDSSEAEKVHHLKQIFDLQEHTKEKESQLLALEEQHRVAQETLLFKDEQLRDAQAWIARFQEMGAVNQTLQAELQELQHYYMALQRQFMDMEQHHMQAIHQLQLELAEARERNGFFSDSQQTSQVGSTETTFHLQNTGNSGNQNGTTNDMVPPSIKSAFVSNTNFDAAPSSLASSGRSAKLEHVPSIPFGPEIVGTGPIFPPGQVTPLPPVIMPSFSSAVPSHTGHPLQLSTLNPALLQNQQALSDVSQLSYRSEHQISKAENDLSDSGVHYVGEVPSGRQIVLENQQHTTNLTNGFSDKIEFIGPVTEQYQAPHVFEDNFVANSGSHLVKSPEQKNDAKVGGEKTESVLLQEQTLKSNQQRITSSAVSSTQVNILDSNIVANGNGRFPAPEVSVLAGRASSSFSAKPVEPSLLDERALLACIVRAIPAASDSGIRISSTLPNRLGKMLAPLHWHDYKKQYGKLDDFVAQHPELFVIEGDFIHLRDGAQEIISATTAVAKVAAASAAAAAAASSSYPSLSPSVAVTPVPQITRLKKSLSTESNSLGLETATASALVASQGDSISRHGNITNKHSGTHNSLQGLTDVKSFRQQVDHQNTSSGSSESRSSINSASLNGVNSDRAGSIFSENRGFSSGRGGFGGRRSSAAGTLARK